jgi:hypothetical protein
VTKAREARSHGSRTRRKSSANEIWSLDQADNPICVFESPDEGDIPPPVETREQALPFERLSWQNFERLCLRLARTDGDVERCRLFGTQGQEQGGIDIYVSRKSTPKYAVWQSKRHKSFTAAQLRRQSQTFWMANGPQKVTTSCFAFRQNCTRRMSKTWSRRAQKSSLKKEFSLS